LTKKRASLAFERVNFARFRLKPYSSVVAAGWLIHPVRAIAGGATKVTIAGPIGPVDPCDPVVPCDPVAPGVPVAP